MYPVDDPPYALEVQAADCGTWRVQRYPDTLSMAAFSTASVTTSAWRELARSPGTAYLTLMPPDSLTTGSHDGTEYSTSTSISCIVHLPKSNKEQQVINSSRHYRDIMPPSTTTQAKKQPPQRNRPPCHPQHHHHSVIKPASAYMPEYHHPTGRADSYTSEYGRCRTDLSSVQQDPNHVRVASMALISRGGGPAQHGTRQQVALSSVHPSD